MPKRIYMKYNNKERLTTTVHDMVEKKIGLRVSSKCFYERLRALRLQGSYNDNDIDALADKNHKNCKANKNPIVITDFHKLIMKYWANSPSF